jgi:hypothetical protein
VCAETHALKTWRHPVYGSKKRVRYYFQIARTVPNYLHSHTATTAHNSSGTTPEASALTQGLAPVLEPLRDGLLLLGIEQIRVFVLGGSFAGLTYSIKRCEGNKISGMKDRPTQLTSSSESTTVLPSVIVQTTGADSCDRHSKHDQRSVQANNTDQQHSGDSPSSADSSSLSFAAAFFAAAPLFAAGAGAAFRLVPALGAGSSSSSSDSEASSSSELCTLRLPRAGAFKMKKKHDDNQCK